MSFDDSDNNHCLSVIFDPMRNTYSLSGIADYVDDGYGFEFPGREFAVPMDRNLAILGVPSGDGMQSLVRVPPATSLRFRHDRPSGCPVHMGCWTLVEGVIGLNVEENLDIIFRVLRDRYRECEYERWCCTGRIVNYDGIFLQYTYRIQS